MAGPLYWATASELQPAVSAQSDDMASSISSRSTRRLKIDGSREGEPAPLEPQVPRTRELMRSTCTRACCQCLSVLACSAPLPSFNQVERHAEGTFCLPPRHDESAWPMSAPCASRGRN